MISVFYLQLSKLYLVEQNNYVWAKNALCALYVIDFWMFRVFNESSQNLFVGVSSMFYHLLPI